MNQTSSAIAVLGSLNIDLVARMERLPGPGETVVARSFEQFPGGKGANQAVACGKLGAAVTMYGALGSDGFADRLLASLKACGVETDRLQVIPDATTGLANIWVDADGENSIAIVAGANGMIENDYLDAIIPKLTDSQWLLLQMEIPVDAMGYLINRLPPEGPKIILDPAPVHPLDYLPTNRLEMITPNEHELSRLTGMKTETSDNIETACRALKEETATGAVLCKAGSRGAFLYNDGTFQHFPGFAVQSVDSTAAGDAFNGALAVALSEGWPVAEAIKWANGVGALCVTQKGAQTSMPSRSEVEAFIRSGKIQ